MTDATTPLDPHKVLAQAAQDLEAEAGARAPRPAPRIEEVAPHLPGYRLDALIGQGGMGAVYRARHLQLDRDVAIKILPVELAKDPTFEERFVREARALALLDHPHILRVYDFGESGGWFFLVTEFVDGANLRQMLQLGKVTPEEAVRLVPQICEALHFAHRHGVVHRDIKPENILVDENGDVKIADFGLAKMLGEDPAQGVALTRTQQVLGTPHYMAPEQIERPALVDHRADIFSLGVVFYEMLTGQLPLGRFGPPSENSEASASLDGVVMRSLEREPERRYQSVDDLKTDVVDGRHGEDPAAAVRAAHRHGRDQRWRREDRSGTVITLLLAGLFLWGLGIAIDALLLPFGGIALLTFGCLRAFHLLDEDPAAAGRGWRLFGVVTAAWLPPLLLFNVLLAWVTATVMQGSGTEVSQPTGVAIWNALLLIDLAVVVWIFVRRTRGKVAGRRHARRARAESSEA